MSKLSSPAILKTTDITVWVSQKSCRLLQSKLKTKPKDFKRIIEKDLGADLVELYEDLPFYIDASAKKCYVCKSTLDKVSGRVHKMANSLGFAISDDIKEDSHIESKVHVSISITQEDCSFRQSVYNSLSTEVQDIIDGLNIPIIEEIPVDICYYWWDNFLEGAGESPIETQRQEKLRNFTKGVDAIFGPWFLNQKRFLEPIPDGEETPHPLIHIPYNYVLSKEEILEHFPRYAFIMDDSIWNFLLLQGENIKDRFKDILLQIRDVLRDRFYYLNIAHEYAHLKARIVREAFILNKGENGNHGAHISPFLFHSESRMREENKEKLKKTVDEIKSHKWRFLLLDDKYSETLGFTCKNKIEVNKRQILVKRLNNVLGENYELDCVDTVGKAYEKIVERKYDVIFIDYLLKEDYGYKLLKQIQDECQANESKGGGLNTEYPRYVGPCGRLFFMFTSAFTTAVFERLVLEGLNRSKDYWYIGEGACPTNTPNLFDYYLINILDKRIQDSGISDLAIDNILKTIRFVYHTNNNGGERDIAQRVDDVRERASKVYHKVLEYHHNYRILKNDEKHSTLVGDFLQDKVHLGAMLEHLLQLVHLTAFGTVRQWPEIWEECQFLMRTVDDKNDDNLKALKNEIVAEIEIYIIDLKSK